MNPNTFSPITFPSLGLSWDPARNITIGPLTIQFYGLIIAVGLLLAVLYGCLRSKEFGFKQYDILDGVLIVVPIACAYPFFQRYIVSGLAVGSVKG